jgi:hypothetical protein
MRRAETISECGAGVAPTALGLSSELFPALTGWAIFCRAYGAEEMRSRKSRRIGASKRTLGEVSAEVCLPFAGGARRTREETERLLIVQDYA